MPKRLSSNDVLLTDLVVGQPTIVSRQHVLTRQENGSIVANVYSGDRFIEVNGNLRRLENVMTVTPPSGANLDFTFSIGQWFITLRPIFYTESRVPPYRYWSDLTAVQKSTINPSFDTTDENGNKKWSVTFTRAAAYTGVGFEVVASNLPSALSTIIDKMAGPRRSGRYMRFVASILSFDFTDLFDSGFDFDVIGTMRVGPGILIRSLPPAGTRITLDPTINVVGDTADNSVYTLNARASFNIDVVSNSSLFTARTEDGLEEWRPMFAFNTGAVLPIGSTISAAVINTRLATFSALDDTKIMEHRLTVAMNKAQLAFGAAVNATSADFLWPGTSNILTIAPFSVTIGFKNFTVPSGSFGNIATAADIDIIPPIDPEQNGWTEVSLIDDNLVVGGWGRVDYGWNSFNGPATRRPSMDITYTAPASGVVFNNRFWQMNPRMWGWW